MLLKLASISPRASAFKISWRLVSTLSMLASMPSALRFSGSICSFTDSVRLSSAFPSRVSPCCAISVEVPGSRLTARVKMSAL